MDRVKKEKLMQEYVHKYIYLYYWPLKMVGYCRFDIKNRQFVKLSLSTLLYNAFILCVGNVLVYVLIRIAVVQEQFLILPEILTILYFNTIVNLLLANATFVNRNTCAEIISSCIDIDVFLGVNETKFMRDISIRIYRALCLFMCPTQSVVVAYMYYVFEVPLSIHLIGTVYFLWLFFAYYDYSFFLSLYSFVTLRVRYLNVAIMKIANVNSEYLPNQIPFNVIFWKKRFDDLVSFHKRASIEEFNRAFIMIFAQLRRLESGHRFAIILGVSTNVMGAFVAVQTLITYLKNPIVDIIRAGVITVWVFASWFYLLILSQQTDMFNEQIEQTKFICAYTQLKPSNSDQILRLTQSILRTLEVRDSRLSIYGLFFFDTGLLLRLVASTFVYITVQLQLAFPHLEENHNYTNVTTVSL